MAKVPSVAAQMRTQGTTEYAVPDPVVICGSFEVDGTNDVTAVRGEGFQVERTGVGVFEITFKEKFPGLVHVCASVQADTAGTLDDLAAQPGIYNSSTGVLEILTYDVVATPALTDGDGPRVNFHCVFHKRNARAVTYNS